MPETTTVYPCQGAQIKSIAFFDEQDRKVNVLQPGETYQLEIAGTFEQDLRGVYFGIHIRNVSGAVVTGQRFPEDGIYTEPVRAGTDFRVRFVFVMNLIQGAYFAGGGVWSIDEPTCAHRILDAAMFRVASTGKQKSFGYVDLAAGEPSMILAPTVIFAES